MIVAISGAHQVGKTTLARELNKRFGLPIVDEAALDVFQKYPEMDWFHREAIIIFEQIRKEQEVVQKHGWAVADRSVWDALAYSKCCGKMDISRQESLR